MYVREDKTCSSCNETISIDNLCLICDECDKCYHPKCKGIFGKNLKPLASLAEWFCNSDCKSTFENNQSTETIVNSTIVDTPIMETIAALLLFKDNVTKEISDVKESQQFLSDLVDGLQQQNQRILKDNELLKRQLEAANQENHKLRNSSHEMEGQINKINQEHLINNIVITNVPKSDNYVNDFWTMTAKMEAKIEKDDVSSIELMHPSNRNNKNAATPKSHTLLVKFRNHNAKVELIKKKAKAGAVLTEQFTANMNNQHRIQAVYFRDHLTNYGLDLFAKCKSIQKQAKYKFCWTKDCQIYLRESEKSKVIRISSLKDIERLNSQHNLKTV